MSNELREQLAELEHDQWMSWSKYVAEHNDLPKELIEKWKKNWKPYSELSEKKKDSDRIWADKILKLIKERDKKVVEIVESCKEYRNTFITKRELIRKLEEAFPEK